jgi:Family of unknown function (DUF6459)
MTAELVQLTFDFDESADFDQLADSADQPGGVVIALHHRRRPSPAASAYQVRLVDGALALKPQLPSSPELPAAPKPAASAPPEVARTAVIVARAMLEVLSGWRPAHQLSRWTSYQLQQDLERRAPRKPIGARLQLRRIRVSEPAVGVAEICALADDPVQQRVRVIAMRLEDRQGEWIVTRLQAG